METKQCRQCGTIKDVSEFYMRHNRNNRPMSVCKSCSIKKSIEWASRNRGKANESVRRWRSKYPERERAACRRWANEHGDRTRYLARKTARKRRNTIKGKLNDNISCRVYQALKHNKQGRSWEALVGYNTDQLKKHIEMQFQPGMKWENHGTVWHIDHIIPVSVFNFERPDDTDFRRCWSLNNLRPLGARENIQKRAHLLEPFQPSLAIGGAL